MNSSWITWLLFLFFSLRNGPLICKLHSIGIVYQLPLKMVWRRNGLCLCLCPSVCLRSQDPNEKYAIRKLFFFVTWASTVGHIQYVDRNGALAWKQTQYSSVFKWYFIIKMVACNTGHWPFVPPLLLTLYSLTKVELFKISRSCEY